MHSPLSSRSLLLCKMNPLCPFSIPTHPNTAQPHAFKIGKRGRFVRRAGCDAMLSSGCCIVCCLLCAMERNRGVFWSDIARTDGRSRSAPTEATVAAATDRPQRGQPPLSVRVVRGARKPKDGRTDGRTEERMRSEYTSAAAALGGRGRNGQRKRGSLGRPPGHRAGNGWST